MELKEYFPIWNKLTAAQQQKLEISGTLKQIKAGTLLQGGGEECSGLYLVCSGLLRAYILSEQGREITISRLFERDICLFSASCMFQSLQFDVAIEAEKDSEIWVIPPGIYRNVMDESAVLANYTNQVMASRFSEVMWLLEQIMWKSFDKRLATFLLNEAQLEQTTSLKITHEKIGNHLGTAREVVTRMLRYFQNEGLVELKRGTIELVDQKALEELEED